MLVWPGRWKTPEVVGCIVQIGIGVVTEIVMARCEVSVHWMIGLGVGLRDGDCAQLASCLVLQQLQQMLLMLMLMLQPLCSRR